MPVNGETRSHVGVRHLLEALHTRKAATFVRHERMNSLSLQIVLLEEILIYYGLQSLLGIGWNKYQSAYLVFWLYLKQMSGKEELYEEQLSLIASSNTRACLDILLGRVRR